MAQGYYTLTPPTINQCTRDGSGQLTKEYYPFVTNSILTHLYDCYVQYSLKNPRFTKAADAVGVDLDLALVTAWHGAVVASM